MDALSAALWSSRDADVLLSRVRPRDVRGEDTIILAAVLDLRDRGREWADPTAVIDSLREHASWWRRRFRDNPPGMLPAVPPERSGPNSGLLQSASLPLRSGRVFEVMCHIPTRDVDSAATELAGARRREVSAMVMQAVLDMITNPPTDLTRAQRADAIGATLRRYRSVLAADHLYPPRRPPALRVRTDRTCPADPPVAAKNRFRAA
jgi:hypothetical protein